MSSAGPGSRRAPAKYFSCRSERSTRTFDSAVRRALSSGGMGKPACEASVSLGKYPNVASSLQISFAPTVQRMRYEMMMTPAMLVTEMTLACVTSVPASGKTSSEMTILAPSRLRKKTSSLVESGSAYHVDPRASRTAGAPPRAARRTACSSCRARRSTRRRAGRRSPSSPRRPASSCRRSPARDVTRVMK